MIGEEDVVMMELRYTVLRGSEKAILNIFQFGGKCHIRRGINKRHQTPNKTSNIEQDSASEIVG